MPKSMKAVYCYFTY